MKQKRVLLFVHDGAGLGHLRRMSRIASSLQGPCATLIVTGQRDALWIIPENCEFAHFPSWDKLRVSKSKYWNHSPWLKLGHKLAIKFKSDFFTSLINTFRPDAILVDYLPFGKNNELKKGLQQSTALKYLINRGIVDSSDKEIFCGKAAKTYSSVYNNILVAADSNVVDLAYDCNFDSKISSKVKYIGYIAPEKISNKNIRSTHEIKDNQQWVVCSAGGGMYAEKFLEHCIEVSKEMPQVFFDVIFGPRANKLLENTAYDGPNLRVTRYCKDLPDLISSCDVAVINGGYNSLMEAMSGGAHIIVHPNQSKDDDEQIRNSKILSKFYPLQLITDPISLSKALAESLNSARRNARPVFPYDTNGLVNIKELLYKDLKI